jgi:RNA polymerase sigma factor (sigma-70 family)
MLASRGSQCRERRDRRLEEVDGARRRHERGNGTRARRRRARNREIAHAVGLRDHRIHPVTLQREVAVVDEAALHELELVGDRRQVAAPRDLVAYERIAALVARSASGDPRAWDELVDRFAPLVWSIARAYRLSDADAEDVFQGTWLLLLEHVDRLTQPGRLAGWLATTARREALRVARSNPRTLPIDEERLALVAEVDDTADDLSTRERDAAVRQALATLPARDQLLVTLLVAEPRTSYEQISQVLGMPIGSISPTRSRCLERLRRAVRATSASASMYLLPGEHLS